MRRNSVRFDLLASHSSCFLRFFNCDLERGLGSFEFEFAIMVDSMVLDWGLAGASSVLFEVSSFIVMSLELEFGAIESVGADASSVGATLRILEGRSSMSDIFT